MCLCRQKAKENECFVVFIGRLKRTRVSSCASQVDTWVSFPPPLQGGRSGPRPSSCPCLQPTTSMRPGPCRVGGGGGEWRRWLLVSGYERIVIKDVVSPGIDIRQTLKIYCNFHLIHYMQEWTENEIPVPCSCISVCPTVCADAHFSLQPQLETGCIPSWRQASQLETSLPQLEISGSARECIVCTGECS
jgi:hypothetical protein